MAQLAKERETLGDELRARIKELEDENATLRDLLAARDRELQALKDECACSCVPS